MSSKEADRIFNIGISYMQKALIARTTGDSNSADTFTQDFINLCEEALTDPAKAATPIEDEICDLISTVSQSRLALIQALYKCRDPENKKELLSATERTIKSQDLLTYYLSKGIKPPEIQEMTIKASSQIFHPEINQEDLRTTITSITSSDPNALFKITVKGPLGCISHTNDELFKPGKINFVSEFKIKDLLRPKINERVVKSGKLIFEVKTISKKFLGTKEILIGTVTIPMSDFKAKSYIEGTFKVKPTENPEEKNPPNVSLTIQTMIYQALSDPELEYQNIQYVFTPIAIDSNSNQKQTSVQNQSQKRNTVKKTSPLRPFKSLSKEEVLKLKPKLEQGRILKEWELSRFLSMKLLIKFLTDSGALVTALKEYNVEIPQNLIQQIQNLKSKLTKLMNNTKENVISPQQYRELIEKQIEINSQEIQQKGPTSPDSKILMLHNQIMEEEINPQKQ